MLQRFVLAAAAVLLTLAPATALAQVEVKKSSRGLTYSLRLPPGYDRARGGGLLVLGLHGQGGTHDNFMRQLQLANFLADAVLVAPQAPANAAWDEKDVEPLGDLIREVRTEWKTLRTIVFGFSRGAYMGFAMGLRRPADVDAVIPHSGGLVVPVVPDQNVQRQLFYVIHGDEDRVVPVQQSREAVKKLQAAGIKHVEYEEIPRLQHTIDPAAAKRAFEWVAKTLGPLKKLPDAEYKKQLAAQKKALKGKDDDAAVKAAGALAELGGDPATGVLIDGLIDAEKKKRDAVVQAIQEALTKLTGETFASSKEWKKWAAGKS